MNLIEPLAAAVGLGAAVAAVRVAVQADRLAREMRAWERETAVLAARAARARAASETALAITSDDNHGTRR